MEDRIHLPPIDDPNPRGNSRGGRGVVVAGNAVLVANYHTLEVCDRLGVPGRAWVVGTRSGTLLECDLVGGTVRPLIDLAATPFAREVARGGGGPRMWSWLRWLQRERAPMAAEPAARPLFWRGLAVDDDWIFVGTSPAAILGFDRRSFAYQGVVRFGANVREIVHGIAIAP
jgi:hypothetical protein